VRIKHHRQHGIGPEPFALDIDIGASARAALVDPEVAVMTPTPKKKNRGLSPRPEQMRGLRHVPQQPKTNVRELPQAFHRS